MCFYVFVDIHIVFNINITTRNAILKKVIIRYRSNKYRMNEQIKNKFGVAGIVALGAFAISALVYAGSFARATEPSYYRSFAVSGEGKVIAVPDIAELSFGIVTEGGKDLGALQGENAQKANAVIAFAKEKSVDEKDIKTSQYAIEPRYQYYRCDTYMMNGGTPCPPSEIVGYTVRQTITIKVRDFKVIGELLTSAVTAGANTVSGPNFTVDDPAALEEKARAEAMGKAKRQAKHIAEAGGFKLGKLLSVDEGSYYEYGMGGDVQTFGKAEIAPVIEPGSQEISVTINLRYEIR